MQPLYLIKVPVSLEGVIPRKSHPSYWIGWIITKIKLIMNPISLPVDYVTLDMYFNNKYTETSPRDLRAAPENAKNLVDIEAYHKFEQYKKDLKAGKIGNIDRRV